MSAEGLLRAAVAAARIERTADATALLRGTDPDDTDPTT